jgi:hypothetical protein
MLTNAMLHPGGGVVGDIESDRPLCSQIALGKLPPIWDTPIVEF